MVVSPSICGVLRSSPLSLCAVLLGVVLRSNPSLVWCFSSSVGMLSRPSLLGGAALLLLLLGGAACGRSRRHWTQIDCSTLRTLHSQCFQFWDAVVHRTARPRQLQSPALPIRLAQSPRRMLAAHKTLPSQGEKPEASRLFGRRQVTSCCKASTA